jgi:hypothetical protein
MIKKKRLQIDVAMSRSSLYLCESGCFASADLHWNSSNLSQNPNSSTLLLENEDEPWGTGLFMDIKRNPFPYSLVTMIWQPRQKSVEINSCNSWT